MPPSCIPFATEEMLPNQQEIHLLVFFLFFFLFFFFSCFTVSVIPSINTFESSINFMILIISFISSFELNKVNLFPALTAPFPLIFLSNLFITLEAKLLTNPVKSSLAKGIARSAITFNLNYLTYDEEIHRIESF